MLPSRSGYGGIGSYHVSDKYIALFSHFIPCGEHEAVYILDELIKNTSDIQPDMVHDDTHAQSAPVFALAHLLGISLMPRIRALAEMENTSTTQVKFPNNNSIRQEPHEVVTLRGGSAI